MRNTLTRMLAAFFLAASAAAGDTEDDARMENLERAYEDLMAKEGIHLGGGFRSEYLTSTISGPSTFDSLRSGENVAYTSVDFDILARPNAAAQGHLILRLHEDWRNLFSQVSNPIFSRWISADGTVKEVFNYHVGDFRQRYSPLTLYTPEPELVYEPLIFARDRRMARDEEFLGGNDRVLQGVDLGFDAEIAPVFQAVHVNLLGARLRSTEVSLINRNLVVSEFERAPADKFLGGGNLDLVFLKGVSAGGSYLNIFDRASSLRTAGNRDSLAQNTHVLAGRLGANFKPMLDWSSWEAGVDVEYAQSRDDTAAANQGKTGSAILARLRAELSGGSPWSGSLLLRGIANDPAFRNELAQSPEFVAARIMNVENDSAFIQNTKVGKPAVFTGQYSTFDALYRHVFNFTPSNNTNLSNGAHYTKSAYTRAIFTQDELARIAAIGLDPALQLILPFGPATPNRLGLDAEWTVGYLDRKLEITTRFAAMEEREETPLPDGRLLPKTAFTRIGGGGKIQAGGLLGLKYPLTLSGSLVRSQATNGGLPGDSVHVSRDITSDFVNAGLYYRFLRKVALLGGYQLIHNTFDIPGSRAEQRQSNLAVGLEYKVADGAYLMLKGSRLRVENPSGPFKDFEQALVHMSMRVGF